MARKAQPAAEAVDLSEQQRACIEQLIGGKTKAAAAEAVGVAAFTVSRWHKDAAFVAALNARRREMHEANTERLRSLASKALDVYEAALESDDPGVQLKAAGQILRAARLSELPALSGETEPDQVERAWQRENLFSRLL
jgi:hypothetical protein